jgi:prepilin-type N-terminal cleavage/methylation domain-containing protein
MNSMATNKFRAGKKKGGFTLIELLLSLALIVVATGLIGYIMQMYARNFTSKGDDIRRKQLAKAVLTMIADDIRAVVLEQEYDGSVLEQQFGSSGGGQGGGAAADQSGSGLASDSMDQGLSADSDSSGGSDLASDATSDGSMDTTGTALMTASYPPGIYGDQYTLMVDVSRLPRADEYLAQQTSLVEGILNDVPGDIKTVLYYVQSASNQGVKDDMNIFVPDPGSANPTDAFASGLVRRALDRSVTAYAQEMGDTDRLMRTGDLVAPEVVSLEFAYFDGSQGQWVYQWDSTQLSLPLLVQISIAMQSASGSEVSRLEPGTPISSLSLEDQQAYGVEVYELVVAIPGANLEVADAAAGMESMGL